MTPTEIGLIVGGLLAAAIYGALLRCLMRSSPSPSPGLGGKFAPSRETDLADQIAYAMSRALAACSFCGLCA